MNDPKDLAERVIATFVQAFAGMAIIDGIDSWRPAAAAGIAAALAVLKSEAKKRLAK